jgi:hypothetical protein
MSPTQYARTVRCTDEVMCYYVCYRYGKVRYGTVLYGTVPYGTVLYIYRSVRYRTKNLEILERGEPDPI